MISIIHIYTHIIMCIYMYIHDPALYLGDRLACRLGSAGRLAGNDTEPLHWYTHTWWVNDIGYMWEGTPRSSAYKAGLVASACCSTRILAACLLRAPDSTRVRCISFYPGKLSKLSGNSFASAFAQKGAMPRFTCLQAMQERGAAPHCWGTLGP